MLNLIDNNGNVYEYKTSTKTTFTKPSSRLKSRVVYSAAHVVSNPLLTTNPFEQPSIDWDNTMNYRKYLWSLGLGVAEAMDTAQRGMGIDWGNTQKLISYSLQEAKLVGGKIACGAGTDQIKDPSNVSLSQVKEAYIEQVQFIEEYNGQVILMASRALAISAQMPDDYYNVYSEVLKHVKGKVILHWLGQAFDPSLINYWGHNDIDKAMDVCLRIINDHKEKVDGIKISLLDASKEIKMRRLLPKGVLMYTGDDFNYPELIEGDKQGYSHALLGIFDPVAPIASAAVQELDKGNKDTFRKLLDNTVPLSRHIFTRPTYYYKTGVVFIAYLNGHQSHFSMLGGLQAARSVKHLSELFVLADRCGILIDPDLASNRMKNYLCVTAGLEK